MCVLAVTKITLQSDFSKKSDKSLYDSVSYNMLMFLVAAVFFSPFLLDASIERLTFIQGIIMGVLSVIFQFFYICAFSKGKMTLTVIINNFSMLLPIGVSYYMFNEPLGFMKIIGILLALVSLVLVTAKGKNETISKKSDNILWLIFMVLVFLSNGFISINQKIYSKTVPKLQVFAFVAIAYISATIISAVILIVMRLLNNQKRSKLNSKMLISGASAGVIIGVFQCLNTYAASIIDGAVLYSSYNCATSILSAAVGRVLFKERLSKKQFIGAIIGIFSIMFLCI